MKRRRFLLAVVALLGVILLLLAGALWKATAVVRAAPLLDSIITPELIRSGCAAEVPFDFHVSSDGLNRLYDANFDLGTDDPEVSAWCTITVAPAGHLLSRGKYRRAKKYYAKLDEEHPDPDFRWAQDMFPNIGRRAIVSWALGPGGGGGAIIFTTSDGRFDIDVSAGGRLREGVQGPNVDNEEIARLLSGLCGGAEE